MDCIFCKIINGDIPSFKVYEDDAVYAFLDISQVTMGHTLVIPKNHVKNIYGLDEETAKNVFKVIPRLAKALKKTFDLEGLNIINNNDKPLQSVYHFHIHLIPRYPNDDLRLGMKNNQDNYQQEDYKSLAESIKASLY